MLKRPLFFIGLLLIAISAFGLIVAAIPNPRLAVSSSIPKPAIYPVLGNHTVKAGETLDCIGRAYRILPSAIAAQNGINPSEPLQPNTILQMPNVAWYNIPSGPVCQGQFTPPPQPAMTMTPAVLTVTPGPQPTPMPDVIEAEWPGRMEVNRSDLVRVSLIRNAQHDFVAQVQITGRSHTAIPDSPKPVGTPGSSLGTAFGSDYESCATADLIATTFEYKAITPPDCQSLDQPRLTWEWSITSKNKGLQNLVLTINAQWTSVIDKDVLKRQVWRYPVDIQVDEPLFTTGQINIASLLVGFLGSGISLKWLYEQRQAKKPKAKSLHGPKPRRRN